MSEFIPRTYALTGSLIYRIDAQTQHFNINPGDLVRFLLDYGLNKIESGELVITTKSSLSVIESMTERPKR